MTDTIDTEVSFEVAGMRRLLAESEQRLTVSNQIMLRLTRRIARARHLVQDCADCASIEQSVAREILRALEPRAGE